MGEAGKMAIGNGGEESKQKDGKERERESLKEGFKRFLRDLTSSRLLPYKMIFFLNLAAVVILWPQFTVHQQSLGLTVTHTGIFSTTSSVLGIIAPLLCGLVGDKIGNYKVLLIVTTLLLGIVTFLFTLVPSAMVTPSDNMTDFTNFTDTLSTTTIASVNITSSPNPEVDPDMLTVTFWTYLCVRVTYGVLNNVVFTLFDAAVMAEMQASQMDYGFQRAWGTLAATGMSFLSGYLVELTGGYSVIFYVSAVIQIVSSLIMLFVRLDFKPPAISLTRNILRLTANAEVIMFFIAMLFAGMFFGFLETYMYRFLFSLGASPMLVGLTVTVGTPFELILTLLASSLVPLTGHAPIIVFGLLGHAIRLLGFSFLVNPWWVLGLEVLESVSNGLLGTVGVMYCTMLFTLESIASFRGIFAVLYAGVGQSIGAASGSALQKAFGSRGAFRVLSYLAFAVTFLYGAAFYILSRWRRRKAEVEKTAGAAQEGKAPTLSRLELQEDKKEGIDNPSWVADE